MTQYKDLDDGEKKVFNTIDNIYMVHQSIERKQFIKILSILINKYELKNEHKGNK